MKVLILILLYLLCFSLFGASKVFDPKYHGEEVSMPLKSFFALQTDSDLINCFLSLKRLKYDGVFIEGISPFYGSGRESAIFSQDPEKVMPVNPYALTPWIRSGKTAALDGLQKYDLSILNEDYFIKLERIAHISDSIGFQIIFSFFSETNFDYKNGYYMDNPFYQKNNINNIYDNNEIDPVFFKRKFYNCLDKNLWKLISRYVDKVAIVLEDSDVTFIPVNDFTGSSQWFIKLLNIIKDGIGSNSKIWFSGSNFCFADLVSCKCFSGIIVKSYNTSHYEVSPGCFSSPMRNLSLESIYVATDSTLTQFIGNVDNFNLGIEIYYYDKSNSILKPQL